VNYKLMEELKQVLKAEVNAYEELVSLLQKEREALITFSPDEIEALSKEKDMVIMKIKLFDEERIKLLSKISLTLSIDETITLSKLVEITKDEEFRNLGFKLISLIQSFAELNEFNKILIEKSSRHIKSFLCFLENCGVTAVNNRKIVKA